MLVFKNLQFSKFNKTNLEQLIDDKKHAPLLRILLTRSIIGDANAKSLKR